MHRFPTRPSLSSISCATALLALFASGCAGNSPRQEFTPSGYSMLRVGDIALAEQPSPARIGEIQAAGYKTVITVRGLDEIEWNEAAEVTSRGMRFGQFPTTPSTIEVGLLARIRSMLESSPKPILLHCASGNRVSLVWGMLEAGKRPDAEIIEIATEAGLKKQYLPLLESYLAKHAAGRGRLKP